MGYEQAAAACGVAWCRSSTCAHKKSENRGPDGRPTVHFVRQRFTKAGLYLFLDRAWRALHPRARPSRGHEKWDYYYRKGVWTQERAHELKVRLPRHLFDEDRAILREALSEYADRVPAHARPDKYKKAKQWARRRDA